MYRHEWKIEISPLDLLELRMRLRAVCQPDPHARNGAYRVRSLYFDTPEDTALREKLDGLDRREKFRVRYYNDDLSQIHLEKKSRLRGLGRKDQAAVTADQIRRLLAGDLDWMVPTGEPLIQELYSAMRGGRLEPKVLVDYLREPFLYEAGNVRVTLDTRIRTGLDPKGFLDPGAVTLPAGDAPCLMEVKYDQFLPDIIRDAVALPGRRAAAFSKYAQCRVYG